MSPEPPLRALILDLGNVLVFHDNDLLFRNLGARSGLDAAEVQRRLTGPLWEDANRGHLDAEGIWRGVCTLLRTAIPYPEFAALWSSHFTENTSLLPHLERLSAHLPLVLLSNTNWMHVAWLQPRLPVLRRFRHLVLSCEVGRVKPEGAIYREALTHTGVAAEHAAFFDDVPEYVEAARGVGLQGFVFTDTEAFVRTLAPRLPEVDWT